MSSCCGPTTKQFPSPSLVKHLRPGSVLPDAVVFHSLPVASPPSYRPSRSIKVPHVGSELGVSNPPPNGCCATDHGLRYGMAPGISRPLFPRKQFPLKTIPSPSPADHPSKTKYPNSNSTPCPRDTPQKRPVSSTSQQNRPSIPRALPPAPHRL